MTNKRLKALAKEVRRGTHQTAPKFTFDDLSELTQYIYEVSGSWPSAEFLEKTLEENLSEFDETTIEQVRHDAEILRYLAQTGAEPPRFEPPTVPEQEPAPNLPNNIIKLSEHRERFCQNIVTHNNAARAYREAGYEPTNCSANASRLLREPEIQDRIAQLLSQGHEVLRAECKRAFQILQDLNSQKYQSEKETVYWKDESGRRHQKTTVIFDLKELRKSVETTMNLYMKAEALRIRIEEKRIRLNERREKQNLPPLDNILYFTLPFTPKDIEEECEAEQETSNEPKENPVISVKLPKNAPEKAPNPVNLTNEKPTKELLAATG